MLKDLLKKEVIRLNTECKSWTDAIIAGADLLIAQDYIESRYVDAILRNFDEMGPYMVIAPGIVLSHARHENGVKKLSMSLITLKEPINFGSEMNDPVKLVITLAAADNESHLKALEDLMELFMDNQDLKSLMEADSVEDVLKIVDKHSK